MLRLRPRFPDEFFRDIDDALEEEVEFGIEV